MVARSGAPDEHVEMAELGVSVRVSAVSLALSGLLVAAVTPWHPDILDRPVDEVVRGFGAWTLVHATSTVAVVLALFGSTGLVAAHRGRLGRLGQAGLVIEVVGVVMTASLAMTEAIVFPVAAARAPALVALDGPLFRSPLFVGAGVLALGWPLGLAMLGVAAARAQVFGRIPGVVLATSGPVFLVLAGPFVPVAGVLAAVFFGSAQLWWGLLLWQSPDTGRRLGVRRPGAVEPLPPA
jgi:hypothetical protein